MPYKDPEKARESAMKSYLKIKNNPERLAILRKTKNLDARMAEEKSRKSETTIQRKSEKKLQ
jgi:hypothetical protein